MPFQTLHSRRDLKMESKIKTRTKNVSSESQGTSCPPILVSIPFGKNKIIDPLDLLSWIKEQ